MRPRWRKVFADLWGNFTRFVLVVLSLMIGLFSVGMIASGYFAYFGRYGIRLSGHPSCRFAHHHDRF